MDFKERYKYNPVTDFLGKGGFARVYKAEDTLLKRTVALKFFIQSGDDKHTLIQEISRAIALTNENLCRYYDAALINSVNIHGEVDNIEVGVIEYIDGGELKAFLEKHPEKLDKLLTDVLHGLAFLHQKGIIHRDLKPQNILIKTLNEPEPIAKITDFGISKEISGSSGESSKLMGTIEYMAPEQFNPDKYGVNGKIGTNLDLWSFSLLLYELLTGEKLFGNRGGDTNPAQIMLNILNEDLINERVNKLKNPYKTVIKRCLVKDAAQRVQKAEDLLDLITKNAIVNNRGDGNETMPLSSFTLPQETIKEQPKNKYFNAVSLFYFGITLYVVSFLLPFNVNSENSEIKKGYDAALMFVSMLFRKEDWYPLKWDTLLFVFANFANFSIVFISFFFFKKYKKWYNFIALFGLLSGLNFIWLYKDEFKTAILSWAYIVWIASQFIVASAFVIKGRLSVGRKWAR